MAGYGNRPGLWMRRYTDMNKRANSSHEICGGTTSSPAHCFSNPLLRYFFNTRKQTESVERMAPGRKECNFFLQTRNGFGWFNDMLPTSFFRHPAWTQSGEWILCDVLEHSSLLQYTLGLQPYPQKVVRPHWHPPQPSLQEVVGTLGIHERHPLRHRQCEKG